MEICYNGNMDTVRYIITNMQRENEINKDTLKVDIF